MVDRNGQGHCTANSTTYYTKHCREFRGFPGDISATGVAATTTTTTATGVAATGTTATGVAATGTTATATGVAATGTTATATGVAATSCRGHTQRVRASSKATATGVVACSKLFIRSLTDSDTQRHRLTVTLSHAFSTS